jgi:hypothetical protein
LKKVEFAVVDDGLGDAVFIKIGQGKDAGFFKGGVFGFDHPHPQPLSQGERGAQGEDEVLGGGGVGPGAIGVFGGGEAGEAGVEVAFEVNATDFVGGLVEEGLSAFVPFALTDGVAGVLAVPGDEPALAVEHLLDFSSQAEGFEGGLGDFGGGGRRGEREGGRGGGRLSTVRLRSAVSGLRSARGE